MQEVRKAGNLPRRNRVYDSVTSILTAVRSLVRGVPLLFSARPRTPLRILCIVAFDTLHRLRYARPLSPEKLRTLAALLDFGACANAAFDYKACCRCELRATRQLLDEAGIGPSVDEYLQRLKWLECERPEPGGNDRQFQKVRLYREAVVRLSLGIVSATAYGHQRLDEEICATDYDADLNLLFRIVMQCQIIDDVLDYSSDLSAGLPSFLTACNSLSQAIELTRLAARDYADDRALIPDPSPARGEGRGLRRTGDLFPLRLALFLVSIVTRLVIVLFAGDRQRCEAPFRETESATQPRDCTDWG